MVTFGLPIPTYGTRLYDRNIKISQFLTWTMVPPAFTMQIAVCMDASAPLASITRSMPPLPLSVIPSCFFMSAAFLLPYSTSPFSRLGGKYVCVAAYCLANSRRDGLISIPIMRDAPSALATAMQSNPTGPHPKTAIAWLARKPPKFATEWTPTASGSILRPCKVKLTETQKQHNDSYHRSVFKRSIFRKMISQVGGYEIITAYCSIMWRRCSKNDVGT